MLVTAEYCIAASRYHLGDTVKNYDLYYLFQRCRRVGSASFTIASASPYSPNFQGCPFSLTFVQQREAFKNIFWSVRVHVREYFVWFFMFEACWRQKCDEDKIKKWVFAYLHAFVYAWWGDARRLGLGVGIPKRHGAVRSPRDGFPAFIEQSTCWRKRFGNSDKSSERRKAHNG